MYTWWHTHQPRLYQPVQYVKIMFEHVFVDSCMFLGSTLTTLQELVYEWCGHLLIVSTSGPAHANKSLGASKESIFAWSFPLKSHMAFLFFAMCLPIAFFNSGALGTRSLRAPSWIKRNARLYMHCTNEFTACLKVINVLQEFLVCMHIYIIKYYSYWLMWIISLLIFTMHLQMQMVHALENEVAEYHRSTSIINIYTCNCWCI